MQSIGKFSSTLRQGGDIVLFITLVPKVFNNALSFVDLKTMGTFKGILIGWIIELSVQMFQPIIVIYIRSNFVYHH